MRKDPLVNNQYYHVLNRSIAQYEIFSGTKDCQRFIRLLDLYRYADFNYKFSNFSNLAPVNQKVIIDNLRKINQKSVTIISYCLMPTHFHLILKQNIDNGISGFMKKILDSYSRYFNLRHNRKGPMWEGHFRNISINTDEQLLHLTRYIHLNPVSAGIVKKPEDWEFSSFLEYANGENSLCELDGLLEITADDYRQFVHKGIARQKELSIIKHLLIENYSG